MNDELLVILNDFASKYFYSSIEDNNLFNEELKKIGYKDGVISFNTEPQVSNVKTSYTDGSVMFDDTYDVDYYYGEIISNLYDATSIITYGGNGVLWLV